MDSRPGVAGIILCSAGLALAVAGCALGPKALERSHGRFGDAVQRVNQEELLRNIVRVRYNESPLSLNVSSIAAQYELAGGADARPFFSTEADSAIFRSFSTILPNVSASGASRPTFTLDPADDSASVRQFLTPINADTLLFLSETGWPLSSIMRLWVERINGIPNASPAAGPSPEGARDHARYRRITELLQACQDHDLASLGAAEKLTELSGPLPAEAITAAAVVEAAKAKMEYRPNPDKKTWTLIRRDRRLVSSINPGAENRPEIHELFDLLNLKPGLPTIELTVTGTSPPDPKKFPFPPLSELRITPRSTAQVYFYLANGVELPAEHLVCGVVRDEGDYAPDITEGLFHVHVCHGKKPPPCAYVAVKYRDYWFYIDDRDHESKVTFMLMQQLSRLDFKNVRAATSPSLTLPVGR